MFRILVVDDNPDAAQSLAVVLELQGYQTEVAHNGAEALHKASRFHPQVVILDIRMPTMNGIEAALALRRHVPHVRLVAITGSSLVELHDELAQAHFDALFTKPADPEALSAAVGELVRAR